MTTPSGEDGRRPAAGEATELLLALGGGRADTSDRLLEVVYVELRNLADAALRGERADHTLQPTALVHEAWLRLVDQQRVDWRGRAHFLGVAAMAMRRVLVDHARARRREKRGGGARREVLATDPGGREPTLGGDLDLLALHEALEALQEHSERAARVVELRFFAGLTEPQVAEVLGLSEATVARDWRAARAWLASRLGEEPA